MQKFIRFLFGRILRPSSSRNTIANVVGIRPGNISLYKHAFMHRSVKEGVDENNERLEYLGDAVLGAIIADYLFKHYPLKGEGFLTEMRSKMVNRQQMNDIAVKMGLRKLTNFNRFDNALRNSQIFGNTLEALIGAIYLDKGYDKTQQWVFRNLITPYLFVDELEREEYNLKNKLIGWAAKNNHDLKFETADERLYNGRRFFKVNVLVDGCIVAFGEGYNKKEASELAAHNAFTVINKQ